MKSDNSNLPPTPRKYYVNQGPYNITIIPIARRVRFEKIYQLKIGKQTILF